MQNSDAMETTMTMETAIGNGNDKGNGKTLAMTAKLGFLVINER